MFFKETITKWESHRDSRGRVPTADRLGRYFVLNSDRISHLTEITGGCRFRFIDNPYDIRENYSNVESSTSFATFKTYLEPRHSSKFITLTVYRENKVNRSTYDIDVLTDDISFAWSYNPDPDNYSWVYYRNDTGGMMRALCDLSLDSLLDVLTTTTTTLLPTTTELAVPDGNPSNLVLTVVSDTEIDGTFTEGSTNQDGFRVYISTDNVTFTEKTTVTGGSFQATGLTANTLYYFYVVAYKGSNESSASSTVDATTYHSELGIYITGLTTPLSTTQKSNINSLIDSLKVGLSISNLSDAFDTFYVLAGETAESSLKNLVKNAHHGTLVGTPNPSFIQFQGFNSDGANGYINTNYNPSTQGQTYQQNSASIGVMSLSDISEDKVDIGSIITPGTDLRSHLLLRSSTNQFLVRINTSLGAVYDNSHSNDIFIGSRTAENVQHGYINKKQGAVYTAVSNSIPSLNHYILARNVDGTPADFSNKQIAFAFAGKGLSSTDVSYMIDAIYKYYLSINSFDVFIIAGQSNASGRGDNSQTFTKTGNNDSLQLGNDYLIKGMFDPVDSLANQTDAVSEDPLANGSVWPLIATSLSANNRKTIFVPCAKGGVGISSWQPGADHEDRTTLYGSMIYRAKYIRNLGGTLRGVLWWQGETDVGVLTQSQYNGYLDIIANSVYSDLNIKLMPCKLQNMSLHDPTTLNAAIAEAWGDNSNVLTGPDLSGITSDDEWHLTTDESLESAADLWVTAINTAFGW